MRINELYIIIKLGRERCPQRSEKRFDLCRIGTEPIRRRRMICYSFFKMIYDSYLKNGVSKPRPTVNTAKHIISAFGAIWASSAIEAYSLVFMDFL